jgi:hypothetical protein
MHVLTRYSSGGRDSSDSSRVPAKRCRCRSRAASTRAQMSADDPPAGRRTVSRTRLWELPCAPRVDPIQQRARDTLLIAADHRGQTGALFDRFCVPTTRARIITRWHFCPDLRLPQIGTVIVTGGSRHCEIQISSAQSLEVSRPNPSWANSTTGRRSAGRWPAATMTVPPGGRLASARRSTP